MTEQELAKLLLINNGDLTSWIDKKTNGIVNNEFFYDGEKYLDIEPWLIEEEWKIEGEEFYLEGHTEEDIIYKDWGDAIADNIDIFAEDKSFDILEVFFNSSTLLLPYIVKYIKDKAYDKL